MDMIRHGQENAALADRLHHWTCSLMLVEQAAELPELMLLDLQEQFLIPEAALRLWGVASEFEALPAAAAVSEEVRAFASSLTQPYCGANASFEAVQWLQSPQAIASLALIPLRRGQSAPAFGLLVLGSPDPTRYAADMGTEFLTRVGELASAAAARLLPPAD